MTPYLSVIIPAFNEENRIGGTLTAVDRYLAEWKKKGGKDYEIIVVDDGSTDKTVPLVQACQAEGLRLIRNQKNHGKGFAVKSGMLAARGQYRFFTDADNSTPIEEMENFLPRLESGTPVVIGSRFVAGSKVVVKQPFYRQALGRLANLVIQTVAVSGIKDTQCGFKAFSGAAAAELFPRQTINAWGFDFEILAVARRRNLNIAEVPVSWYNSKESRVRPLQSAIRTLAELMKIRINLWRGRYD